MILKPMVRNNICINAHPAGCASEVASQIRYARSRRDPDTAQKHPSGPRTVLVIGCSTGYGLATRIVSAFGYGATTYGVSYEKAATESRVGTAGWYNNRAFDEAASIAGLDSFTFDGDAFSGGMKEEVVKRATEAGLQFDVVIYSLASPVRVDPETGIMYKSVIKPLYRPYRGKSVDMFTGAIAEAEIAEATEAEAFETVKVMGGEDWQLWIRALAEGGLLSSDAMTLAYSYIGPSLSWPIYHDGTIGKAKAHLEYSASVLNRDFGAHGLRAFVSVNKALVTRASAVIPIIPLYVSTLFKVMKERGIHEDCIAQADRLFRERLYTGSAMILDDAGRIRIDDLEMGTAVQAEVESRMLKVREENLFDLADIEGFRTDFLRIHGFAVDGIDYSADVPCSGVSISLFDPVGTEETVREGVRGKM